MTSCKLISILCINNSRISVKAPGWRGLLFIVRREICFCGDLLFVHAPVVSVGFAFGPEFVLQFFGGNHLAEEERVYCSTLITSLLFVCDL